MDDDPESELIRLRKLVEDSLLQAEKENMAILQRSNAINFQDNSYSSLKQKNSCPHIKSSLPCEQTGSLVDERNTHSRIHFLNNVERTLLPTFNKRRLLNEAKNKYTPCAIPLSPPIRLKRDTDESVHVPESIENNSFIHPPLIHTCRKSSSKLLPEKYLHMSSCSKSLRNEKLLIEKNFPCTSVNGIKENFSVTSEKECNSQDKQTYRNTPTMFKDQNSPNNEDSFISNEKFSHEIKIPKVQQDEDSLKKFQILESKMSAEEKSKDDRKEKNGFHLQISLDSCSTKDAIDKVLDKIPEIVNKFGITYNKTNKTSTSEGEKEEEKKFSDIIVSKPNKIISERHIHTMSSSTQTKNESFRNADIFSRFLEKENDGVSVAIQTDNDEDNLPIKKQDLHNMVKEMVLDTLKSAHICDNLFFAKMLPTSHKVDSGIQTEEESDVPENIIVKAHCAGNFLKQENVTETRNLSLSKDEMDFKILPNEQEKNVSSKSSAEIPNCSFEKHQEENLSCSYIDNFVGAAPERSSTPNEKTNIELMLEKIYEQVSKEKEAQENFNDNQFINSVYTRDVAVQFNPLQTSSKSTSTAEIKKIDSSCQYDVLNETNSMKSYIDTSVQVENCTYPTDQNFTKIVDAYTQSVQEQFSHAVTQTEAIADSELSTANTSGSATPVSENMFMDDLLSEGEIALPWNLRLLSLSGGTTVTSNPDHSDTSIKEKDYSLSEGEIHPSIVPYLNLCPCNLNDGENEDSQNDVHRTKYQFNSKPGTSTSPYSDKHGFTSASNSKVQLQVSNSFLSESDCNSNASLSVGEVPPNVFRSSFINSLHMTENHQFNNSNERVKLHNESALPFNDSDARKVQRLSVNFPFSENDVNTQNFNCSSPVALKNIDKEIHNMND